MGWNDVLREGFVDLERFQGSVVDAKFQIGNIPGETVQGIQLVLKFRVDVVELPQGTDPPDTYQLWYSIGDKNGKAWDLADSEGTALWPKVTPMPGFVKTSKIGLLIARLVELNAPILTSGYEPHQAAGYVGMNAIWVKETIAYPGLNDSDVTRPVQILGAAQPVGYVQPPVQQQAVSAPPASNGSVAVAPPPSISAPPPAAPATVTVTNWDQVWGANNELWRNYIRALVAGKGLEEAVTIIVRDDHLRADSNLINAVNDRSFFAWAEQANFMKVMDGLLV